MKFRANSSNGSLVLPCRYSDGQTGMGILIVAFSSFATAPKYLTEPVSVSIPRYEVSY